MFAYIIRRLLQMVVTLFLISIISFVISALSPTDPYAAQLDPKKTATDLERQRDQEGFDDPIATKYVLFYQRFFSDLGAVITQDDEHVWQLRSLKTRAPILPTMWSKMLVSLPLFIVTTLIVWTMSFPIGIYSAIRRNSFQDRLITIGSYALIAIPGFWLSLEVIKFFTARGIPIISPETLGVDLEGAQAFMDSTWHMGVPGIIASLGGIAVLTRYVKGSMLEVMGQDYVRTARAKGLDGDVVTYKHALRNASLPFVTMIGGLLPGIFGGSIVFEAIYNWPGLGRWIFEATFSKDLYVVVTALFVSSALTLLGILISDILYTVADPRVRLS